MSVEVCVKEKEEKRATEAKVLPTGVLRELGVYGLDKLEPMVLAGLLTGDPVLLVGKHGSAKTLLCERLAQGLGLSFHAYDASKAMFEDVLGFPDPTSLSTGKVAYVPTPISIWGKEFVLVDELSRATPVMQSKWLELIRSRRVMGQEAETLRYLFGAMNPIEYAGTMPLDEALAARFSWVLPMPQASAFSDEELERMITQLGRDDGRELPGERFAVPTHSVAWMLPRMRRAYLEVEGKMSPAVRAYVKALPRAFSTWKMALDGRRLAMIYRNQMAYLTVELLRGTNIYGKEELARALRTSLPLLLPHLAMEGRTLSESILDDVHGLAAAFAKKGQGAEGPQVGLLLSTTPLEVMRWILRYRQEVEEADLHAGVSEILRAMAKQGRDEAVEAFAVLLMLGEIACEEPQTFPPSVLERILEEVEAAHTRRTTTASMMRLIREWQGHYGGTKGMDPVDYQAALFLALEGGEKLDKPEVVDMMRRTRFLIRRAYMEGGNR